MGSRLLQCLTLGLLTASLFSCGRGVLAPTTKDTTVPTLSFTCPAFADGAAIPARYTCDGANVSPPLRWLAPPKNIKSLAITCDDPDAPAGDWTHWVIYDIPPTTAKLPEAIVPTATDADGVRQGRNSFGKVGYSGPCPPQGSVHHYVFRLYALDVVLSLSDRATAADVQKAAQGHELMDGILTGTYGRP